jgi:hypothetical protein
MLISQPSWPAKACFRPKAAVGVGCRAGSYITQLPKAEHDAPEWQAAMEALLGVAERDCPAMMARIGVKRALNRHVEPVFNSSRKDTHWGKRKFKCDG